MLLLCIFVIKIFRDNWLFEGTVHVIFGVCNASRMDIMVQCLRLKQNGRGHSTLKTLWKCTLFAACRATTHNRGSNLQGWLKFMLLSIPINHYPCLSHGSPLL